VLWAAVNIIENIVDLSMTQALQRVVPTSDDCDAHARCASRSWWR
jgi:hypothetical protein